MATYQLRALSFGEILDGAFAVYRHNFGVLVGISAICIGIPAVLSVYMSAVGIEFVSVWIIILWMVLYSFGGLIAEGATIHVISEAYLGIFPRLGEAIQFALGRMLKIFVAGLTKYLIIILATMVPVIVGSVAIAVAQTVTGTILFALCIVASLVVALVMVAGYSVVIQAAVLETETSAVESLRRSWMLTGGYKLKALGLGIVIWILLMIPVAAGGSLALFVPSIAALFSAGASVLQLIVYPVFASTFTLLYYDLRVRKEAFDIEYLGQQLGIAQDR